MDKPEREAFLAYSALPKFRRKVDVALKIIREALEIDKAYVACSWGKDSTALLHLCQQVQPTIPAAMFTDPRQDLLGNYTETIRQYTDQYPTSLILLDLEGDCIAEKLRHTDIWHQYPVAFLGLRIEEKGKRVYSLKKYGAIHQYQSGLLKGSHRACPLLHWTWQDIWAYTIAQNLPYLDSYDDPMNYDRATSRTSAILPKNNTRGAEFGRIARLKARSPEYYAYLQEFYPEIASYA